MADHYEPSPEAVSQLREAVQFLKHEREDVRRMAVHGLAAHSKDNRDLWAFMRSSTDGSKAIDTLLQYLHAGSATLLGDILTILINIAAEGSCAEALVQHKIVRKAMRLLDGMEKSALPDAFVRGIEEMTLMLLNNLTASHLSAVDDLLQKEDEDMRGFYLGKLQRYYSFLTPSTANPAEPSSANSPQEAAPAAASPSSTKTTESEREKKEAEALAAREQTDAAQRDLRKWILQILLNVTRTYDGQELLLDDEDWRGTLNECLSSPNPLHRLLAAQCLRNCACSQKPQYALMLKSNALVTAVHRLATRAERSDEVQLCLAEFIASTLESEEGMSRLESVNAKGLLIRAVKESEATRQPAATAGSQRVEVLPDDESELDGAVAPLEPLPPLSAETCELLTKHVLPYLDDIVDAYLAPGSEEVD